jgi:hypothetical protein
MKIEDLRREITATASALDRVDQEYSTAVEAIRTNGVAADVAVLSSHGEKITKRGINPNCKVLSAARTLQKQLSERLGELRAELRRLEAAEKGKNHERHEPVFI